MGYQRKRQQIIFLCMIFCMPPLFFGCKEKTISDSQKTANYTVEKSFYKGPMRVEIRLSDDNIILSDLLEMELVTTIDPEYTIQLPSVAEAFKQFKVRSLKEVPETTTDTGKIEKTYQYQLEPLELGMCEIPALTFTFESKEKPNEDSTQNTLETESLWVDVSTSLPADPNAMVIDDIKDVVEIKANYTWLWVGLGGVGLLAAGIIVGMVLKPKKAVQIRRIYKSAHEIAFEVLRAIAQEKLVEQGHIKEFYEKLSGCLRQYIENRFQLRAPEQTTEEFLEQLRTSGTLKLEHKQELRKFLEHCDLVKFARYQPNDEQINESLTIAENFVEKTKSDEHMVDITGAKQEERQVDS